MRRSLEKKTKERKTIEKGKDRIPLFLQNLFLRVQAFSSHRVKAGEPWHIKKSTKEQIIASII